MGINFIQLIEQTLLESNILEEADRNVLINIGIKAKKARQLHTSAVANKNTNAQLIQRKQLFELRQALKTELSNFPLASQRRHPYTDAEVDAFIKANYDNRQLSPLIFLHSDMIKDLN